MTIRDYSYFDGSFVTNTSHSITGDMVGDFAESVMGVSALVVKSADYTATESDEVIIAASNCATVTLPACASTRLGKRYTLYHARGTGGAVSCRFLATGSDTFSPTFGADGVLPLARTGDYVTVVNRGNGWYVIAGRGIFGGIVFLQTGAVTVASSSSETTLLDTGFGGVSTLPAAFFGTYTVLKLKARGYVSNTSTPTLTIRFKLAGSEIVATASITTASGLSGSGWSLDLQAACRSVGGSGTIMTLGEFRIGSNTYFMTNTTTDTIDTTAAMTLGLTAQWGTLSASNTITCQQIIAEVLR